MLCIVCHKETPVVHGAGRPRKYCSTACRQRAYRQRHEHIANAHRSAPTPPESGEAGTVIAVFLVPAAVAQKIEQQVHAGLVVELGILPTTRSQPEFIDNNKAK